MVEWRSQAAYLPQQVFLYDNSLRCNVALGEDESEIDETRLREALRQARLTELVMDKATSVLDNETEKEILIEFQRPKGQKR